jgi:hypothetical protein
MTGTNKEFVRFDMNEKYNVLFCPTNQYKVDGTLRSRHLVQNFQDLWLETKRMPMEYGFLSTPTRYMCRRNRVCIIKIPNNLSFHLPLPLL